MIELRTMGSQAGFDVAQAPSPCELRERHAQILVETGEVFDLVLAAVTSDATPGRQRQVLQCSMIRAKTSLPWFIGGHQGLANAPIRVEIETRQKQGLSLAYQSIIAYLALNVGTAMSCTGNKINGF
jgi:hypothetical protein